ncbi:hypothetical protein BGZ70_002671 [Mortierella alpina]|uniref:FBD domain-containing protein n=1 Tax=Mortierella alpina TaxID=64518 RepID=A0A9P6ITT5_MORAP|nr:hypothetical protein BGZ70_002671 [Mortierella alpina]
MEKILAPEMVHLIIKTLNASPKQGIPIESEWHRATPFDPFGQPSKEDLLERPRDLVVTLTVKDVLEYNQAMVTTTKILTVTDQFDTLLGVDPQVFAPPQPFASLVMVEHLGLDSIQPKKINWLLKPVASFTGLRSLIVTNTFLDREGALSLWKVFPQLEVLSLMDVHFLDMTAVRENMKDMICPHLLRLYLHYNNGGFPIEDQYQLFLACPSLKALHWVFPKGTEEHAFKREVVKFRQGHQRTTFREVQELHIVGDMDDYGIALAMNNMPGIRSLSISVDNQIGVLSLGAISTLATNLTRCEIHSPFTTSVTIELVLSSCPLLHTMVARTMTAYEATRDKQRTWICASSLKVLCLSFVFESHEAHLQDEVLEKLARLTKLLQLVMIERCDQRPGTFGLQLRLGQGLETLKPLKKLKFLSTRDDFGLPLRAQELTWMELHWPELMDILYVQS